MRALFCEVTAALAVAVQIPSQQLLWEHASSTDTISRLAASLGDFDGDGADDVLVQHITDLNRTTERSYLRILSGTNGTILDNRPDPAFPMGTINGVGDFDLDGYPDYATKWDNQAFGQAFVQVWSPHRQQQLLMLVGSRSFQFGDVFTGRVDLDGDGLPDIVVGSTYSLAHDFQAFDHFGNLLYRVDLRAQGKSILSLTSLQDLNGDGCTEYLVGGIDAPRGGYVAVVSGINGSFLRVSYDQMPGDIIGYPIAKAGDMDRDGVIDYATGNFWGGGSMRSLITVYSGASGAIMRHWEVHVDDISAFLIGGRDVDLDGVPDIVSTSHGYRHDFYRFGRSYVWSSRDQQALMHIDPTTVSTLGQYGLVAADLGVQPGSPYPVFAVWYRPPYGSLSRLQIWRCSPPGVQVTGTGCNSAGLAPTIGVRRVETSLGEQCRVVLGSAPSGAVAWCVAAAAHETTFGGVPLPMSLDPIGFPRCNLYVPPTLIDGHTVGATGWDRGYAEINAPLRLDPQGFGAAVQWLVFDFANGSYASTPRLEVSLR